MKTFSQRKGLKPVSEFIQIDSMNAALRNSLWNALDLGLWSTNGFVFRQHGEPYIKAFSQSLWFDHFKKPIDSRPRHGGPLLDLIRQHFFSCEWNEVYDFLEFVVGQSSGRSLAPSLNAV